MAGTICAKLSARSTRETLFAMDLNLLPAPRSLKILAGHFLLPPRASLKMESSLPRFVRHAAAKRIRAAAQNIGVTLDAKLPQRPPSIFFEQQSPSKKFNSGSYFLKIRNDGVRVQFHDADGFHASIATLRQLLRQCGRRLPHLEISDWPDFARRGVMLDVSRGRVPNLETLLDLAEHLADFKINELQLYVEHTFAYRNYKSVWRDWGALTGAEIRQLDARCRELGIDLVPNQNSFGHLRYFLKHPRVKKLAEVSEPYEDVCGEFVRRPTTLAPNHSGTMQFLRELYDELLPHFSSRFFNVGCDETWDLGRGQSSVLCERRGKDRVYLDFVKKISRETAKRNRTMMFWGDIILKHPELIRELPRNVIALNWGYEANHPFDKEAAQFAKSKIPFYVCPGTSTWMTLIGRHDNAFANLRAAARAGRKHGALGYLIADWGDGGHPQPLAVSWLPYLFGASVAWRERSFDEQKLVAVLSRDIFHDTTNKVANAACALGFAHLKFNFHEVNQTQFGTVIAAPPPEERELFCRNGLKCFQKVSSQNISSALAAVERSLAQLAHARPETDSGKMLVRELELAARMAAQSCKYMLWQKAVAAKRLSAARKMARANVREIQGLERDFKKYWPLRNKGTTAKCSSFLKQRVLEYRSAAVR